MKKKGILNSEIASVLAKMGHTDTIVIADCGLPIPAHVKRIDIALKPGTPGFMETLQAVADDMEIEHITIAEELISNQKLTNEIMTVVSPALVSHVSHEVFKTYTHHAMAVIRTGETTPYANIILHSGVTF